MTPDTFMPEAKFRVGDLVETLEDGCSPWGGLLAVVASREWTGEIWHYKLTTFDATSNGSLGAPEKLLRSAFTTPEEIDLEIKEGTLGYIRRNTVRDLRKDIARLRAALAKIANTSLRTNLKPGDKIGLMNEIARAALEKKGD